MQAAAQAVQVSEGGRVVSLGSGMHVLLDAGGVPVRLLDGGVWARLWAHAEDVAREAKAEARARDERCRCDAPVCRCGAVHPSDVFDSTLEHYLGEAQAEYGGLLRAALAELALRTGHSVRLPFSAAQQESWLHGHLEGACGGQGRWPPSVAVELLPVRTKPLLRELLARAWGTLSSWLPAAKGDAR